MRFALLLSVLILLFADLKARDGEPSHFLPGATVYNVIRDAEGIVWFGTNSGLIRYDGYEYTTYTVLDGLPSNEVFQIETADDDSMWMINFTGQPGYLKGGGVFSEQTDSRLRGMSSGTTHTALFIDGNTVYVGSEDGHLAVIDDEKGIVHNFGNYLIRNIYTDDGQRIWLNVNGDGAVYHPGENRLEVIYPDTFVASKPLNINGKVYWATHSGFKNITGTAPVPEYNFTAGSFDGTITSGALTDDGKFAVGTTRGLYFFSKTDLAPISRKLEGIFVTSVFYDAEGNIWASTLGNGVYLFTAGLWNTKSIQAFDWNTNMFTKLAVNSSGEIIVGTGTRSILKIADDAISATELEDDGQPVSEIGVVDYAHGNLILGGTSYLYWAKSQGDSGQFDFIKTNLAVVKGVHIVSPDTVYASSIEGIDRFIRDADSGRITQQRLATMRTSAVLKHPEWGVLYGTPRGLYIIDEDGSKLFTDVLQNEQITVLKLLSDGTAAVGTNGMGVWLISDDGIRWLSENDARVLSVREIKQDEEGALWIASPEGLFVYQNNSMSLFERGNVKTVGLLNNSVAYASSGTLLITGKEKGDLENVQLYLQTPRLTVDGEQKSENELINLRHDIRSVSADVRAVYFRSSGTVRYYYTFDTRNPQWEASVSPQLLFRDMRPGRYRLSVKATAENGELESNIQEIIFRIKPPFWQTPVFLILLLVVVSFSGVSLVKIRVRSVQKKEQEKLIQYQKTVELEQQALSAMMNPHFVFNVLNSIRYYVAEKTPEEAQKYLSDFARLIRLQLEGAFRKNTPLSAELERLEMYVRLETLRLKHPLAFSIDTNSLTEDDLFDIEIPAMLLQPFIENAIWHGIQPKDSPGKIKVTISLEGDETLCVEILDNGVGIETSRKLNREKEHASLAMHLIKERLKLIGAEKGKRVDIRTDSEHGKGTKVTLSIPV